MSERPSSATSDKRIDDLPKSGRESSHSKNNEMDDPNTKVEELEADVELDPEDTELTQENRNVRRIIAEDPEYNLATVAELEGRALQRIIDNFAFNTNMYGNLKPSHKRKVLEKINVDIPLKVVCDLIEEGIYWERKCRARWNLCDISHYGKCWKRLFMERNLQEIVENFIPERTDPTALEETLKLSAPYVKCLRITQMLPPIKVEPKIPVKTTDDGSDAESDTDEAPKVDHLNLNPIVSKLPNLTELKISYDVKNIGMNFEWNVFQFTVQDCQNLAECVAAAQQLKVFHLNRSRVDCDRCRVIISKLLNHPSLIELDLSHNHIGDRGTRAIGKLLNNNSELQIVRLTTNKIHTPGGQAIGFALTRNKTLLELDLRMNRLMDDGGQMIAKSLMVNKTLHTINLGANELSEPTAALMAQVLKKNISLTNIDLSNNRLGPDGGKQLQEGMEKNRNILKLDLRFTDCGDEALFAISQIVSFNQKVKMYNEEVDPELKAASNFIIRDLEQAIFASNKPDKIEENNVDKKKVKSPLSVVEEQQIEQHEKEMEQEHNVDGNTAVTEDEKNFVESNTERLNSTEDLAENTAAIVDGTTGA